MDIDQYCDTCKDSCNFIEFNDIVNVIAKINNPFHVYKMIVKKTCIENIITYYTENGDWFSITKPYENAVLMVSLLSKILGKIISYKGVDTFINKKDELISYSIVVSFGSEKIKLIQNTYFTYNIRPVVFAYSIDGIEKTIKFADLN